MFCGQRRLLERILFRLDRMERRQVMASLEMQQMIAAVQRAETVMSGSEDLIRVLADRLSVAAQTNDMAAVGALAAELNEHAGKLASAIEANTEHGPTVVVPPDAPFSPNAPKPVETTTSETPTDFEHEKDPETGRPIVTDPVPARADASGTIGGLNPVNSKDEGGPVDSNMPVNPSGTFDAKPNPTSVDEHPGDHVPPETPTADDKPISDAIPGHPVAEADPDQNVDKSKQAPKPAAD